MLPGSPPTLAPAQGCGAISSPLSHSAQAARCPSPGTHGSWESGSIAPATNYTHTSPTTPDSLQVRKRPRGTEISPACSAPRSLLQSPEPTLPALQRRPVSRLLAGCGLPLQGVRGAVRPGPCRPHPWGALALGIAQRARPRGSSPGPRAEAARAACSFQTRTPPRISPPCRSFLIPSMEINVKVKAPAERLSQTGRGIFATFLHLFWACSSPFHRNSNIFSP